MNGSGPESISLNQTIPYYSRMIFNDSNWPTATEYPQTDSQISDALDQVCSSLKEPRQALEDAAVKTAKILGW